MVLALIICSKFWLMAPSLSFCFFLLLYLYFPAKSGDSTSIYVEYLWGCSNSGQIIQHHPLCFIMAVFQWISGIFLTLTGQASSYEMFTFMTEIYIKISIVKLSGDYFRGNWEVSRRDANHPRFIAMVASDRNFLDTDIDEYPAPNSRSVICCRIVAIIVNSLSLGGWVGVPNLDKRRPHFATCLPL